MDAFTAFYDRYPKARACREKILLIDQFIHSFHISEKTGDPAKSVASKLLEGNKKVVVQFLDDLSALAPEAKRQWRRALARTIDGRIVAPEADVEA